MSFTFPISASTLLEPSKRHRNEYQDIPWMDLGQHLSSKPTKTKWILLPFFTFHKHNVTSTQNKINILLVLIYQGTVIMVLSFVVFTDAFLSIQTITYAALIISEILNILTSVNIPFFPLNFNQKSPKITIRQSNFLSIKSKISPNPILYYLNPHLKSNIFSLIVSVY